MLNHATLLASGGGPLTVTLHLTENIKANLSMDSPMFINLDDEEPHTFTVNAGETLVLSSAFGYLKWNIVRGSASVDSDDWMTEWTITPISGNPDLYIELGIAYRDWGW